MEEVNNASQEKSVDRQDSVVGKSAAQNTAQNTAENTAGNTAVFPAVFPAENRVPDQEKRSTRRRAVRLLHSESKRELQKAAAEFQNELQQELQLQQKKENLQKAENMKKEERLQNHCLVVQSLATEADSPGVSPLTSVSRTKAG